MIKKINYIFSLKQKVEMIGIFLLTVIAGALETLGLSAIMPLVNVMLSPDTYMEDKSYIFASKVFPIDNYFEFIVFMIIAIIAIYVLKNVYLIFVYVIQLKFTYGCNKKIVFRLLQCYIHQDYLFHVNNNVADIQRNVTGDVTTFFNMVQAVLNLLVEVVTVFLILVFLLFTDWYTTVLLMGFVGVSLFCVYKVFKKYQVKQGEAARKVTGKQTKWLLQTFGGIKEIKAENRENYFFEKYVSAYSEGIQVGMRSNILSKTPKYVMETICISVMMIVIGIRIVLGVDMTSFVTIMSAFALAAVRLLPSFNRITEYLGSVFYSQAALNNIYSDLRNEDELRKNVVNIKEEHEKILLANAIEVKNISFSYPAGEKKIFENASVNILKNKSVAFIGSSGSGKTTLADILLGLLKPMEGEILVDGKNIFDHMYAWHRAIGYIPQNIYLLDDTIRENVLFGADNSDDNLIWDCLHRAQLDEFVKSLPDGLDTSIGECGARLSGGQRQRIGIARALYSRPDILILDEATSALDNDTERAVMDSIERLQGSVTLIIIAHRLSTISKCDYVYEVVDGKIVERCKDQLLS